VHVSDLASAHVAALDWLAKGNASQSINLGNGRGCSVAEVVRTEEVTGSPVEAEICPRRAGDPPVLVSEFQQGARAVGLDAELP
jgi:UDP-glucose 4-epimerase